MISTSAQILNANLKKLRIRHTLTQERVAELAGLDYKFLQSIENGRRPNVTLQTLDKLAAVFGIKGHQLIALRLPQTTLAKNSVSSRSTQ